MLNVPFYKDEGEGVQCMQIAMNCALKYFLDEEFSLERLDELTGRREGLWTYTPQIVTALHDLGLDIRFYSGEELEPSLGGEPYIREHFGVDAEKILEHTDVEVVVEATRKLLDYNVFEKRELPLEEIVEHISRGHIPMVLVDANVIYDEGDFYQGHFAVLTGFDDENIYYHESGPRDAEPNKKVKKEVFEKAMNANGTDNDCVIVYGKRE
jgi:hypothetical protein|tara:strand:+ start:4027 stop:4659 length:633 start_codon:yes stop_codon:yes gene_type:complete